MPPLCKQGHRLSFRLSCLSSPTFASAQLSRIHAGNTSADGRRQGYSELESELGSRPRGFESRHPPPEGKQALTCGNAVRIRSARDGVPSNTEAASFSSGLSFRPPICANPAYDVQGCSPTYASPNQPAMKVGVVAYRPVRADVDALLLYTERLDGLSQAAGQVKGA